MTFNRFKEQAILSGFSLVELSIVLIIIGLLVAGVSSGSKLIQNSKQRTVISDVNQYRIALNSFKATYDEFPGDMKDSSANAFWGVTNSARNTSNPEGDGYIGGTAESAMAFWHMALAELIPNVGYTGASIAGLEVPGVNVGVARYSKDSGFTFFTLGKNINAWGYGAFLVYLQQGIVVLGFGKVDGTDSWNVPGAVLTPAAAYRIDKKLDDGVPSKGGVMSDHGRDVGNNNQCLDYDKSAINYLATDEPVSYRLDSSDVTCRLMFRMY